MRHRPWTSLTLALALFACLLLVNNGRLAAATSVFINEIHYDNDGADSNEGVEVAGPAGTDLTGWQLVPYNGANGESYSTTNLSGTIADQQNGLGAIFFAITGLQNGAPDGVALVDAGGNVVQFLSYEGSFTAVNGPANGLTSVDIGVSEPGSTTVGDSLQLSGTGCAYEDFTWNPPAPNTYNAPNTNQTSTCGSADLPPEVSGTLPADGATGVALDANVEITFSEPVTVTGTWYDITCTASGAHPAAVSGGPQTYTLDPTTDFDNGETCTVTVFAAQVSDQDGTADNMAADYSWSFTTIGAGSAVINEINADPDATNGDANGDGTVDTTDDEFVELVNNTGAALDVSGWTLSDGVSVRHTFPADSVIPDQCAIVVFAGGTPTGAFGNALVQTASSGTLGLNNAGDTITLNDGSIDRASYSYGGEGGDNQSLTRDPDVTGPEPLVKHTLATGAAGALFSPGTQINGDPFSGCPGGISFIHDVQGSGATSPLDGMEVTIEGIVVGDFQEGDADTTRNLRGFYVQEEDSDADGDANTSEGVFVFDGTTPAVDVNVGDLVQVAGTVTEFFDETQVEATSVTVLGSGLSSLVTAGDVDLPTAATLANADGELIPDLERVEGMLVRFPEALSVTELFNLDRFGELRLSEGGRLVQFTHTNAPDAAGYDAHLEDVARRTITLDDGQAIQNPDPILYPDGSLDSGDGLRMGDTIAELTGVVRFSRGSESFGTETYRIMPTETPVFVSGNARPAVPANVGGNVTVASFNVLNYFTTLGSRGADDATEFQRQQEKLVTALTTLDADMVGLMEIENNATAVADLVTALNDSAGAGTYAYVDTGIAGDDEITVALIYKPGSVTPVGGVQILDDAAFTDPNGLGSQQNRPAVAQTFADNTWGERITVIVNHLKSKGSACGAGDDDTTTGQGNCNGTRAEAASYLVNTWLPADPTGSGDPDFLIIGDLNAYAKEDPISAVLGAGYTDLLNAEKGSAAYTYVFDGQYGYLDHALASSTLTPQVTAVTDWHINADEPDALDYNLDFGRDPTIFDGAIPYRASDHDPVLTGLDLTPDQSDLPASYGLAWHTGNGELRLGDNWTNEAGNAVGDDEADGSDDGVAFGDGDAPEHWTDGPDGGALDITVSGGNGCVDAWIDWDNDGAFTEAADYILQAQPVTAGFNDNVKFDVPAGTFDGAGADRNLNYRVRLTPRESDSSCSTNSSAYGAAPSATGRAIGGEVEDGTFDVSPTAVSLHVIGGREQLLRDWLPLLALLSALLLTILILRRRSAV